MVSDRQTLDGAELPQDAPLPGAALLLSGLQHVAIIGPVGLVFPLLVLRAAEADILLQKAVICASLIALGIGSLLLCMRGRGLGSGFLAPSVFTAAYLPASVAAAQSGGLSLVFGMTLFAGLCEIGFSFALRRLRPFLPVEIAGLAVVMIGMILGLLGFRLLLGLNEAGEFATGEMNGSAVGLGMLTLLVTIALNIWGKGPLRLFSVLIGLAVTYPLAVALGAGEAAAGPHATQDGLVTLPSLPLLVPTFDWAFAVPFFVGALACALRATGDITTCQKIVDPQWIRPDLRSISRGVRADGVATVIAGALGTVGLNTFSGSIGLSQATGVVQRRVGFAIAALFVAMAFLPPVVDLAIAMPAALTGAVLVFSSAFILANGLSIIVARLLDSRRILAIGIAVVFGISHDVFVEFYDSFPLWLHSISSSSLVVAMVTAVALNAIFRIGVKRSAVLHVRLDEGLLNQIVAFCREQGGHWGARREVMERAANALTEAGELALTRGAANASLTLHLHYDEYRLIAEARCALSSHDPVAESEPEFDELPQDLQLELRLMQHYADKVTMSERGGQLSVRMQFET